MNHLTDNCVSAAVFAKVTGQSLGLVQEELRNGNLPSAMKDGVMLVDLTRVPSETALLFSTSEAANISKEDAERLVAERKRIEDFILVTSPTIVGKRSATSLGLVSGDAAMGINVLSEFFFQGVRDVVGGRSKSLQNHMRKARQACMDAMREQAIAMGAHAVVSVQFELTEFSGKGTSMLLMSATGTAISCE